MMRCMVCISSGVGSPIRMPIASERRVPAPRKEPTLGETPASIMASSQLPKRCQFRARSRQFLGKDRERVLEPPIGAGVHASPMISVVMPCVILERHRPSRMSGTMEWLWDVDEAGADDVTGCIDDFVYAVAGDGTPGGSMADILPFSRATSP